MLAYLEARAIDSVEQVVGQVYARTVLLDGQVGTVEITHVPERRSLAATIRFPLVQALAAIVERIRHVFDLGADVEAIGAHLATDPFLAPLVAERPGLRAPGGWDGFELAVRAVLGQQVSVEAGRQLACRLVQICGVALPGDRTGRSALARTFPTAAHVAVADLTALGMPAARKQVLVSLAQASLSDPFLFRSRDTVEETVARLSAIRGIGEWTAHYIALRAAREPDAFPTTDVGLLRGAARRQGRALSVAQLRSRAERWRPWRGYAAQHLWAADGAPRSSPKGDLS
jgi:AraC family transcriptional regulator of adaptative response / DNA-3-methyladenine glycosylase II